MIDKNFTTIEQQIDILKKRGLKFGSEETASSLLLRFGYYNIINGYKDPYITVINDNEKYKDNVTFEQIYSLYSLDRAIRNEVMNSLLEFEDNLRAILSYVLGSNFSADEKIYLNRHNFNLGKKKKGKYPLDDILRKFNNIHNDELQPFKHYRETYNNLPPWILLKGASFGNLVNFIKLQKTDIKNEIISLTYNIPKILVASFPKIKELFSDTIFVALDYRNRAAHGGRIYNFRSKSKFRFNNILHDSAGITSADYRNCKGDTGLPILIESLKFCENLAPYHNLVSAISYFSNKHLEKFPEDITFLNEHLHCKKYMNI